MKSKFHFVCQECGHSEPKWLGKCPGCEAWNSFSEEGVEDKKKTRASRNAPKHYTFKDIPSHNNARITSGIGEFDRVLGGGIVPGSMILVGGDPGIGKATLLLQVMANLSTSGKKCLYVSAEESLQQIKLRAERINQQNISMALLTETEFETIAALIKEMQPDVIVIDSIQTVGLAELQSATGSVSQIRQVTNELVRIAKDRNISVFLVGHVTKDGAIAGPKVMEHMVDTVLYFEGERSGSYRLLRTHKNRFGAAHEVGIFEMESSGLTPIQNPSEIFLTQRSQGPGASIITSYEGTRPLLLEVQALNAATSFPVPRRTSIGIELSRVNMICAVLERHAGIVLSGQDIYINVVGGVRVNEPAADLGVLLAIASSANDITLPTDLVCIGEIGLTGELRSVTRLEERIQEAAQLGFKRCLIPAAHGRKSLKNKHDIELQQVNTIGQALEMYCPLD